MKSTLLQSTSDTVKVEAIPTFTSSPVKPTPTPMPHPSNTNAICSDKFRLTKSLECISMGRGRPPRSRARSQGVEGARRCRRRGRAGDAADLCTSLPSKAEAIHLLSTAIGSEAPDLRGTPILQHSSAREEREELDDQEEQERESREESHELLGRPSSLDSESSDLENEVEHVGGGLEEHIWPSEMLHRPH